MKVILLADVPKVGNRFDVKDFKEGYAQNVLIARGLAELATPQALAKLDAKKALANKKREEEAHAFDALISSIEGTTVTIKMKANEKGHLFKALSARDVATAIKNTSHIDIDEHAIIVGQVKELGEHMVSIKKGNKVGKCKIIIEQAN